MNISWLRILGRVTLILSTLITGCGERLPADFDIAGLWCVGEQGICLKSKEGVITLYLFGVTALDNQSLKYYTTIIEHPHDAIAHASYSGPHSTGRPYYYKSDELSNELSSQIEFLGKAWLGVGYSWPAKYSLHFNGYALDAGDSEINLTDNSADEFVIRSDCTEKLKYIVSEQKQLIFNHYLQHGQLGLKLGQTFYDETKAMKPRCARDIDILALNGKVDPYLLETKSDLNSIRYLSATDIELGGDTEVEGDKKPSVKRLTRIPLASLQRRIHANDSEMDFIISKLGLANAMQKSKSLLALQSDADKPESRPDNAANSVTPQKSNSAPTLQPASLSTQDVLTALFGNYDPEKDRAIIESLAVPVEPGGKPGAPITAETKILWTSPVNYKGTPHQLIVLVNREIDDQGEPATCHGCSPIVGAALLGQEGSGWKAVAFTPSIAWAGSSGQVEKPVLEAAGKSAWVLRFDNRDGQMGTEWTGTDLIALMPDQFSKAIYLNEVLSLTTHSDNHGESQFDNGCNDDPGCTSYDVKLEYIKQNDWTLYDMVATTRGYVEKSHGNQVPFVSVDYYAFTGRRYERDVAKSAKLTRQLTMQPEVKAKVAEVADASQSVKSTVPVSSDSILMPNHVIGDTYVNEVINLADGKHGSTTERRVVSVEPTKIVIESKSLSSKKGTVRILDYTPEWNLIRSRNPDGDGLDYAPPLKYFEFPLHPGKNWQQTSIETNSKTGAQRAHTLSAAVGDWEMVTVPAGTFRAIKVTTKTELLDQVTLQKTTGSDTSWYVPELRRSVKSETSSQKQDGSEDKQVIHLLNYKIEN